MNIFFWEIIMELLPTDVRYIIFTYCGDVARSLTCSVSKSWQRDVIAVSTTLCPIPKLYTIGHKIIPNKEILGIVLRDYHLCSRLKLKDVLSSVVYKANNINVIDLYQTKRIIGSSFAFYAECMFDKNLSDNFNDIVQGSSGEEFLQTCYTGNVNNIAKILSLLSNSIKMFGIILSGIRIAARRQHISAVKYLLNLGPRGECYHSDNICSSVYVKTCFTKENYLFMTSKHHVDKEYIQSPKYNTMIEFLINEYIPSIHANNSVDIYKYLAYQYCISGSLCGFKLAYSKLSVDDRLALYEYLGLSCRSSNLEITEYIISLGVDEVDLVDCFLEVYSVYSKTKYMAMECHTRGFLTLGLILRSIALNYKIRKVREFLDEVRFKCHIDSETYTKGVNEAFSLAFAANDKDSVAMFISLGCTNYDKKLYALGVIAEI